MEGTARKKTRKEKSDVSEMFNDAAQSSEDTLDPSIYLTYDILRIVFQYLDGRNLSSAAMVCRSWLEAANKEKMTRGPCCFIQRYIKNPCCLMQRYNKWDDFLINIRNIRIKPDIGFFFISEKIPHIVEDEMKELLPDNCEALMLYSRGVIMDNKEMEYSSRPHIVCAFLPQIPNVTIKSFRLTEYCHIMRRRTGTVYDEIIDTIVNHDISLSNHETSTCFMLFCNYSVGYDSAKRWASAVQKCAEISGKENHVVSVWGGVLRETALTTKNKTLFQRMEEPNCITVLITGRIQTWSTVLDKKCNTKEQVEARLKLFKDKVKLRKHSIGFMFVCTARGTEMHAEINLESTIFKRLFPKVPLVGCFGYGEFGNTTVNEVKEESE